MVVGLCLPASGQPRYLWLNAFQVSCCSAQGLSCCLVPPSFLIALGSIPVECFHPLTLLALLHVCIHQALRFSTHGKSC